MARGGRLVRGGSRLGLINLTRGMRLAGEGREGCVRETEEFFLGGSISEVKNNSMQGTVT